MSEPLKQTEVLRRVDLHPGIKHGLQQASRDMEAAHRLLAAARQARIDYLGLAEQLYGSSEIDEVEGYVVMTERAGD